MNERSKTNREVYIQKYPREKLPENPILCAEAIGYLKALKEYFPSEQKWVEAEIKFLTLIMLFYTL